MRERGCGFVNRRSRVQSPPLAFSLRQSRGLWRRLPRRSSKSEGGPTCRTRRSGYGSVNHPPRDGFVPAEDPHVVPFGMRARVGSWSNGRAWPSFEPRTSDLGPGHGGHVPHPCAPSARPIVTNCSTIWRSRIARSSIGEAGELAHGLTRPNPSHSRSAFA